MKIYTVMYYGVMDFIDPLKETAQKIIELSDENQEQMHTWNEEKSAPDEGYNDRAGFLSYDEILELTTDVFAAEDEKGGLLRTRLAYTQKDGHGQELFTIITLDFNSDLEKITEIIAHSDTLSQQILSSLLNEPSTAPKRIHVSLESGKDAEGKIVGKRYEFTDNEIHQITKPEQTEFLATLDKAYKQIVTKMKQ